MGRRETVTLKKYAKEFNGAPLSLDEFAEGAAVIVGEDGYGLSNAAKAYLEAKKEFEHQLRKHDVEIG